MLIIHKFLWNQVKQLLKKIYITKPFTVYFRKLGLGLVLLWFVDDLLRGSNLQISCTHDFFAPFLKEMDFSRQVLEAKKISTYFHLFYKPIACNSLFTVVAVLLASVFLACSQLLLRPFAENRFLAALGEVGWPQGRSRKHWGEDALQLNEKIFGFELMVVGTTKWVALLAREKEYPREH